MVTRNSQQNTIVQSHIQMPKLLLKRFHNNNNRFFYYDIQKGFVGTKGTAESTNTELGFYSISTEHYLRDTIETPFGQILAYIDKIDFSQKGFRMTHDFDQITRNFVYSLLSRDPVSMSEMEKNSIYAQFLPKRSRHDYAARNGLITANKNKVFLDYIITFMVNRTDVPFVLPIGGVFSYEVEKHSVINLPISPQLAISLVHESYADRLKHEDGALSMFLVEYPEIVKRINGFAFSSQMKRQWGCVICPEREELDRLKDEATTWI